MYAHVINDTIQELFADKPERPADWEIVEVPASAKEGDVRKNGAFAAPSSAAPALAQDTLLSIADIVQEHTLAQVFTFTVADLHNVTTRLDRAGQDGMKTIALWALLNQGNADAHLPYSNVDYSPSELNASEALALVKQAGDKVQQSYAVLNAVAADIKSGAITTQAQIEAANWPKP